MPEASEEEPVLANVCMGVGKPGIRRSKTDKKDPSLAKLRINGALPESERSEAGSGERGRNQPGAGKGDSDRPMLRKRGEGPGCTKSRGSSPGPILVTPTSSDEEPTRKWLRIRRLESGRKKSGADERRPR